MAGSPSLVAHITGNPNVPGIITANVRAAAGSTAQIAVLFRSPVGTRNLTVLDVQIDPLGTALNGKVYQWFKLRFPDGVIGWVRDDLITIEGDGSPFGYPMLSGAIYAFNLLRAAAPVAAPVPTPPAPPPPPVTPPPVVVAPPPPAPAPAPVVTPPMVSGIVMGTAIGKSGVNMRQSPVSGSVVARLDFGSQVRIVGGQPQGGTSNYVWAKVESSKGNGWIRNDLLSISGDGSGFGLSKGDEFPAPMVNDWWVRGFNVNHNPDEAQHLGWDMGANTGEPVLSAPVKGLVMRLYNCTKCTPDKPNTPSHGLGIGNGNVFMDPAWGFGYGNAVIVRYLNEDLPQSTRDRLAAWGWTGSHLYVMYAHLEKISVSVRQELPPQTAVGTCGNTGNSEATHLHLEVRASVSAEDNNWSAMRSRLLDPTVAFLR